jgi:hypothetical protein
MALEELNRDLISFKRLSGKAHTIETFLNNANEVQTSNVSISYSTIFANDIDPFPITNGNLTGSTATLSTSGVTDGVVERIRFEIEPIPFRTIDDGSSQSFRLKLPSGYSGTLSSQFSGGSILYEALGKLQIVPPLYGQLNSSAVNEYDPILYQSDGTTVIPALDPINWNLDFYSGILFVQDPTGINFDTNPARPTFIDAYLYVGDYLDDIGIGTTGGTGERIEKQFNQLSHGFVVGDVVGITGGTFYKTLSTEESGHEPLGVIIEVPDVNTFTIGFAGTFEGFATAGFLDVTGGTLQANRVYFLSSTVAGKLTFDEPQASGDISKPMIYSINGDDIYIYQYRGRVIEDDSNAIDIQTVLTLPYVVSGQATNITVNVESIALLSSSITLPRY